jgi:hypothetical protein
MPRKLSYVQFKTYFERNGMKSDSPKVIALQDYQKPNYLIPEVALIFDLYDDYTIVNQL